MKTLVLGATGLLGRQLLVDLLDDGKKIRAAYRNESRKSLIDNELKTHKCYSNLEWYFLDLFDLEQVIQSLEGVAQVYHAAALVDFEQDDQQLIENNLNITKNILNALIDTKLPLCYFSSIVVLDKPATLGGVLDEQAEWNAQIPHSAYASSKYLAEMEVWRAVAEGQDAVVVNPAVILGVANSSSGRMLEIIEKNPFFTSGIAPFVDVRDVSRCAIKLTDNQCFGERFILLSAHIPLADFAKKTRALLGKKLNIFIPNRVLKIFFLLGRFSWLFKVLKPLNSMTYNALVGKKIYSNQKVKERISHDFFPIEESIIYHTKRFKNGAF